MECDIQFLLFAELCIVGAASQDSFNEVFEHVETAAGIDEQPERELNNIQIAAVLDGILRRICGNDAIMHEAVIDSMYDMFDSNSTQVETKTITKK